MHGALPAQVQECKIEGSKVHCTSAEAKMEMLKCKCETEQLRIAATALDTYTQEHTHTHTHARAQVQIAQAQQGEAQQRHHQQQQPPSAQDLPTAAGQPPPAFVTPEGQPPLTPPHDLMQLHSLLQGLLAQPDQSLVSALLDKLAAEVGMCMFLCLKKSVCVCVH